MKKIASVLFAFLLLFMLAACKDSPNSNPNNDNPKESSNKPETSDKSTTKYCPNFVGMDLEDILSDGYSEKYNLELKWDYNNEYEYRKVYNQTPEAKSVLENEREKITLYVSMGVKAINVPDVVGIKLEQAKAHLNTKGFTYETETIDGTAYPEGYVAAQAPESGTTVPEGTLILLYISSGN